MGKKSKASNSLGRCLIKDRFGHSQHKKFVDDNSMLHTTEIQDGYDWGRLNLQSVTEESSFQEFLSTAELAGTEFQAEKLNIKFVNPRSNVGILTKSEIQKLKADHNKYKEIIKIPRRPIWTSETTPEQLQQLERESFLEWRRILAQLQEDGLTLTPYEKNLEFWRQLWRVVERSDVVVQIVDARNPLLFRCEDLEKYVNEVSKEKINMILINKADFLLAKQRQYWADYFTANNIRVAFFSALDEADRCIKEDAIEEKDEKETDSEEKAEDTDSEENDEEDTDLEEHNESFDLNEVEGAVQQLSEATESNIVPQMDETLIDEEVKDFNTNKLLTREELIELFRITYKGTTCNPGVTTIGFIGYPNVGKSSTINALMTVKKVSVSATPGKTKHFQTLFLENDLMLCDCPGLVMPSFVFTKAEMIINGILPIDHMRDHVPPTNTVCNLIPRYVIEDKYGIMLPLPMEGEDQSRPPFSEELLNAYGFNRGFMTANGQPDNPRAARYILKDFINGKLLYAHAPPNIPQEVYHVWPAQKRHVSQNHKQPPREIRAIKPNRVTTEDLDKNFFRGRQEGVHIKGRPKLISNSGGESSTMQSTDKPWKKINKHTNKNRREKLRKVYAHLDQH